MRTKYKLILLLLFAISVNSQVFSQQISAAEYFWDTDPGAGNAIAMAAADGSFSSSLEKIVASTSALPGVGVHILYVRVRDGALHWGKPFSRVVDINPSLLTKRDIKVIQGECFWDADPGQGNGVALVAFDGVFDEAIETVMKSGIALPPVGVHTFSVRVKDAETQWSMPFKTVMSITALNRLLQLF